MSTSVVYSPHTTPNANLPSTSSTAESPTTATANQTTTATTTTTTTTTTTATPSNPRHTRSRSSAPNTNTNSASPSRTAPPPTVSTRSSRQSQSSKSPEKKPALALFSGGDGNSGDDNDDTTMHIESEGEPELDPDDLAEASASHTLIDESAAADDPDSKTHPPKITFIIGRKRKAVEDDDAATDANGSINAEPAVDGDGDDVAEVEADPEPENEPAIDLPTAASTPAASNNTSPEPVTTSAPTPGGAMTTTEAPTTTASTPIPDDKPKRAPRKRRKWLRKGEVDPDDPKAVAEQKARHALIDAAIVALDEQERQVLDGTHPQLIELWDELESRRNRLHQYSDVYIEEKLAELLRCHAFDLEHIKLQHHADCNDLADTMSQELHRKKARITAEKVYLDAGKPSAKRMYTNMPTLGEGRGSGGWWAEPTSLLYDGSERLERVLCDDGMRKRRAVAVHPTPASSDDINEDLIDLGLREAPEPSPEPEAELELEQLFEPEVVYEPEPPVEKYRPAKKSPRRVAEHLPPPRNTNTLPPPLPPPPKAWRAPPPPPTRPDPRDIPQRSERRDIPDPRRDLPMDPRALPPRRDFFPPPNPRDPRDHRDPHAPRDPRDQRDPRDPHGPRDPRDPRDPREPLRDPYRRDHYDEGYWYRPPPNTFDRPPPATAYPAPGPPQRMPPTATSEPWTDYNRPKWVPPPPRDYFYAPPRYQGSAPYASRP